MGRKKLRLAWAQLMSAGFLFTAGPFPLFFVSSLFLFLLSLSCFASLYCLTLFTSSTFFSRIFRRLSRVSILFQFGCVEKNKMIVTLFWFFMNCLDCFELLELFGIVWNCLELFGIVWDVFFEFLFVTEKRN